MKKNIYLLNNFEKFLKRQLLNLQIRVRSMTQWISQSCALTRSALSSQHFFSQRVTRNHYSFNWVSLSARHLPQVRLRINTFVRKCISWHWRICAYFCHLIKTVSKCSFLFLLYFASMLNIIWLKCNFVVCLLECDDSTYWNQIGNGMAWKSHTWRAFKRCQWQISWKLKLNRQAVWVCVRCPYKVL